MTTKGFYMGIAAALPHMQKQKSGHIINIDVDVKLPVPFIYLVGLDRCGQLLLLVLREASQCFPQFRCWLR